MKIGFIGQGWIGKNYADDFENRGREVIRYALEEPYAQNKSLISQCDIVFIAVPTPTTKVGFDDSYVRDALSTIGNGNTAVIKSTITVGTTKRLQADFPHITIMHSPEFLRERTAAYDAANPNRNLLGVTERTPDILKKAKAVLAVLPFAPYSRIMDSDDAELVKYAGNCFLYTKVLFMNLLYDLVHASDGDWSAVREALVQDPRIGESHTEPVHASGHVQDQSKTQRGAGGHCFIKDFETFRSMYRELVNDSRGNDLLRSMVDKNIELLVNSDKDIDLLEGVYGDITSYRKSS